MAAGTWVTEAWGGYDIQDWLLPERHRIPCIGDGTRATPGGRVIRVQLLLVEICQQVYIRLCLQEKNKTQRRGEPEKAS